MARAFRITSITGPEGIGSLNLQYHFYGEFEYDPGEPFETRSGKVIVRLKDTEAYTIAIGKVENSPYKEIAIARVTYLVIQRLMSILSSPTPELRQLITLSNDDVNNLLQVDPNRVQVRDWIQIPSEVTRIRKSVFISCGQRTQEERELGQQIAKLVKKMTGLEGYFAEYQTSLEGLTANIFNSLYESAAFIAVMHRRDGLMPDGANCRGSVWIEQEIAVASFMVQTLGISLPSRAYIQEGIPLEGVRGYIILNPITFNANANILDDLESWLPSVVPILK